MSDRWLLLAYPQDEDRPEVVVNAPVDKTCHAFVGSICIPIDLVCVELGEWQDGAQGG